MSARWPYFAIAAVTSLAAAIAILRYHKLELGVFIAAVGVMVLLVAGIIWIPDMVGGDPSRPCQEVTR